MTSLEWTEIARPEAGEWLPPGIVPLMNRLREWLEGIIAQAAPSIARDFDPLVILASVIGVGLVTIAIVSGRRKRRPTQAQLVRRASEAGRPGRASKTVASADDVLPALLLSASMNTTSRERPRIANWPVLVPVIPHRGAAPAQLPLLQPMVRIGRGEENDIRLNDRTVHRNHAVIQRSNSGGCMLIDVSGNSGNGIQLNGQRVDQCRLAPGDVISIGAVQLRFEVIEQVQNSEFPIPVGQRASGPHTQTLH